MTNTSSTVAQRVSQLIEEGQDKGNASAAARRCGLNQSALQKIASGTTKSPRMETLARIAAEYNVPLDWIVRGGDLPPALGGAGVDTSAVDEIIRWVDSQHTRRELPELQQRILKAYEHALYQRLPPAQLQVLDDWRDATLSAHAGDNAED